MKTDLRAWLNAVEAHSEIKTVHGAGVSATLQLEKTQAKGSILPVGFQVYYFRKVGFGFVGVAVPLGNQRQIPQRAGLLRRSRQSGLVGTAERVLV